MNKCSHPGCDRNPCYDDAAWHMQIAKPTKTPWHVELELRQYSIWGGKTSGEIDRVATLCGDKDFDPIANANAAFIVRAVNAHEELLDKTKALLKALEIRFARSGCNSIEEKALKELRQAVARAETI